MSGSVFLADWIDRVDRILLIAGCKHVGCRSHHGADTQESEKDPIVNLSSILEH